jgi:hypothetical protein
MIPQLKKTPVNAGAIQYEVLSAVASHATKFGSGTRRQSAGLKSQWIRFNSEPSHQIRV